MTSGGHGLTFGYGGAVGHVELEVVLVHLGAGRLGVVGHSESTFDLKLSLTGLEAHDVGDDFDAFDFLANVIHFDFHRSGSWRRHTVIGDFLVDYADEMWALGVEFEREIALGIGLGASGFFHALTEAEEDDVVSGGGLAGAGVFDGAGQSLGGGEGC